MFASKNIIKKIYLCICVFLLSTFSFADGPSFPLPIEEEQLRWQREQEAEERKRQLAQPDSSLQQNETQEQKASASSATELPQDEMPCYVIQQFVFELPSVLPEPIRAKSGTTYKQDTFYFLNKKIAFARGKCLGLKGISFLVDQLLIELMHKGYTTTRIGVVREQDLSTGVLRFMLLPGSIGKYHFQGELSTYIKNAFPTGPGDLLNIRDLEQGIEQIERVSSTNITIQLAPGEQVGESDILLTITKRKPWRLIFGVDDSGVNIGERLQASATAGIDNLMGLNDTLVLSGRHEIHEDSEWHNSRGLSIYYSLPWKNWTFSSTVNHNQSYNRRLYAKLWPLNYTEQSNADLKASYMFYRNQTQKNNIELKIGKRWTQTSMGDHRWRISGSSACINSCGGFWYKSQHRNTTFAELTYAHRRHFGPARLDLNTSYRQGVPWLGADTDGYRPSQKFNQKIIDATLNLPFVFQNKIAFYTTTLRTQWSNTEQDGANRFSIGGRVTVRGFDENSALIEDQGYFLQNEIQMPLGKTKQFIYYGLDIGSVYAVNESMNSQKTLAGAAVGLRGSLFPGFSYDISVAIPVYRPVKNYGDRLNSKPIWSLNLRQSF